MTKTASIPTLRTLARGLVAPAAVAMLALAGCRSTSSPCAPPPCAPDPYPQAPIAQAPAPMPMPAPAQPSPEVEARLRIQEETIARQQALISAKQQETDRLAEQARATQIALENAKAAAHSSEDAAERLEDELKGMNGARVMREGGTVLVIVTDCFESGSERLKPNPDVRAALLSTAAAILRHPEAKVEVVGHSDSKPIQKTAGKWADNLALSRARADTVAKALAGGGVPTERIEDVEGRGSAEPLVAPEKTASDRAKNRRVEIRFSFAT